MKLTRRERALHRLRYYQGHLARRRWITARYPPRHALRVVWLHDAEAKVLRCLDELWGAQHSEAVQANVLHDWNGNPFWGVTK